MVCAILVGASGGLRPSPETTATMYLKHVIFPNQSFYLDLPLSVTGAVCHRVGHLSAYLSFICRDFSPGLLVSAPLQQKHQALWETGDW